MELIIALLAGLAVGLGMLLLAVGIVGSEPRPKTADNADGRTKFDYPATKLLLWPTVTFAAVFLATQWIVAGAAAAFAAAVIPKVRARNRAEAEHVLKTEALAAWIDMLRDGIVAGGGLEGPLMRSAETGPEFLRPYLVELVNDMRILTTAEALANFANNVEHHIADMLVSSYSVATRESTAGLPDLLTGLAQSAALEVRTYRRVQTSRRQLRSSVKITLAVLGAFMIGSLVFARDLVTAFDDGMGQFVLLIVCVMLLSGWMWMQKLQMIRRPPRFFALEETDEELLAS